VSAQPGSSNARSIPRGRPNGGAILHSVNTDTQSPPLLYDPQAPMTVPYSDVIAARNAVAHLVSALTDASEPPSDYRKWRTQSAVAVAVAPEGNEEFESFDAAVEWLRDLQHRMTSYLPYPVPGEYTIGENGRMFVTDRAARA